IEKNWASAPEAAQLPSSNKTFSRVPQVPALHLGGFDFAFFFFVLPPPAPFNPALLPFNPQFSPFPANHLTCPYWHAILSRVCQAPVPTFLLTSPGEFRPGQKHSISPRPSHFSSTAYKMLLLQLLCFENHPFSRGV